MLPLVRGRIFADNWRDEAQMALLGITGGSLYFLLENTALIYTQASNVAIIIAATPLLTTLAVHRIAHQESAGRRLYICSLVSLRGRGAGGLQRAVPAQAQPARRPSHAGGGP